MEEGTFPSRFQGFRLMGSCPFSRTRRTVPCMGGLRGRSLPISRKLWKHPSSCNSAVKGVNHAGKQEKIYGSVVPFDHAV